MEYLSDNYNLFIIQSIGSLQFNFSDLSISNTCLASLKEDLFTVEINHFLILLSFSLVLLHRNAQVMEINSETFTKHYR